MRSFITRRALQFARQAMAFAASLATFNQLLCGLGGSANAAELSGLRPTIVAQLDRRPILVPVHSTAKRPVISPL